MVTLSDFFAGSYALALAPGFFRVYSHVGALHALEEAELLHPTAVSGSSAGAQGAAFLASGMKPSQMIDEILKVKRTDIWDWPGFLGILKGDLLQDIYKKVMPTNLFEDTIIPLGLSALDLWSWKVNLIHSGEIAPAIGASACFPGLFAPVQINDRMHIDAGLYDQYGLNALPHMPADSKTIISICFDKSSVNTAYEAIPDSLREQGARLLCVVINNNVQVTPFSMENSGPASYHGAKNAILYALQSKSQCIEKLAENHYVTYIDAATSNAHVQNVKNLVSTSASRSRSSGRSRKARSVSREPVKIKRRSARSKSKGKIVY